MVMASCCSSVCLQCVNISFRKFLSVDVMSAWSYVGTGTSELEKAMTKVSVNANAMENLWRSHLMIMWQVADGT